LQESKRCCSSRIKAKLKIYTYPVTKSLVAVDVNSRLQNQKLMCKMEQHPPGLVALDCFHEVLHGNANARSRERLEEAIARNRYL
jgi:hypothetical protein